MEAEGLLPRLHVPAASPYPEPDQSRLCPLFPLPEDMSSYHPINAWVFKVIAFPTKTLYAPLLSLFVLHTLPK